VKERQSTGQVKIGLLTGGDDKTYAHGLTLSLVSKGVFVDFIGSDFTDGPEIHGSPLINALNLRGNQNENVPYLKKVTRILKYYCRLVGYAATARPRIFHILWNNKFEFVDRVLLMICYKLMGKKVVFTAHNVNAAKRDNKDTLFNRATLKAQYWMSDHIFVHTNKMKDELLTDFGVSGGKVGVIPFGINNTFPRTLMNRSQARKRLGLNDQEKVALFFGQIAPYKGLEYLVRAMARTTGQGDTFRLLIAGKIKPGQGSYWESVQAEIASAGLGKRIIETIRFISDEEVESLFKAADVLILPYTNIYQSGLPFLAYSYGLPVVASDAGGLPEDVVAGRTGLIFRQRDPDDLARAIDEYFSSDLYNQLESRRQDISDYANDHHSWTKVADMTCKVYESLL
jgi:D-inositol-3-phosphate glycosyltransferase